ncbi:MAG: bifunctional oligoribonuclease/PAP phosphatase NrnA [Clostridia bacterium]|nr:bifunctional oligoribonuclease/PAP phosphatase NrnA [Clostridia bacterium]
MNLAKQIADYLLKNNNYYILVHKNPDGDCLGSASALCLALRSLGKNAKVVLPNQPSPRLMFMWDDALEIGEFPCDTAICTDVASFGQMGELYETVFKNAPHSVCIDHHGTNDGYANINYIDALSAATGEIILKIIEAMDVELTVSMAKSLLVSVADDTGSFQYSNTTVHTHLTAARLYEVIPDPEPVMRALYGTHTFEEVEVLKAVIPTMEYHFGGSVCMMFADIEKIKALGADPSNIDAWVGLPRSVKGVEVAAVFKIHSNSEVKVSFRSNDYIDVAKLAAKFGGGGHMRAAGATFFESVESAKEKILNELKKLV